MVVNNQLCVFVCVYVFVYVGVWVYIYIYIYIYTVFHTRKLFKEYSHFMFVIHIYSCSSFHYIIPVVYFQLWVPNAWTSEGASTHPHTHKPHSYTHARTVSGSPSFILQVIELCFVKRHRPSPQLYIYMDIHTPRYTNTHTHTQSRTTHLLRSCSNKHVL